MKAIIETGGKQYYVAEGDIIYVEKLDVEEGSTYTFNKVLAVSDENLTVGTPYVKGATVTAKVEKQGRQKKIIVFHFRRKKNEHKKQGHRQAYTKVLIKEIVLA